MSRSARPFDAVDALIYRAFTELAAVRFLKGSIDMSSPQFDALVAAVANLSVATQAAAKTISDHAAVAVDSTALAGLTAQAQTAADTLNQAVAANPPPPAS